MLKTTLLLAATLLATSLTMSHAQTATTPTTGKATVSKGILTISTPSHNLLFSEASYWTIRQMSYNGKILLSQTGAFGSVANSKGPGWEGTGHGHETVEKIELVVDGKSHAVAEELEATGSKFVLKKQSRFGPYRHWADISFDGKNLHEKFNYEVIEDDSKVNFIYAFMHCMTNKTDKWMAQPGEGELIRGEFLDDNSFTLQKDILWAAVHASSEEIGLVYVYPEVYKGAAKFNNSFWNRPRDNKLYLRPELPRGIGTKFGYEVTLQAFTATPEKWEETANAIVAELKK